ncbi:MAG: sulfurtransferase TusA family protein [Pseudomonadales bacterium]|nr:sulfurtransferase TusA family protein [Pseudomonadales bacterium]
MTVSLPEKFQSIAINQQLDACGLACPLPLLKARQALRGLQPGETLLVLATDAGSWRDFAAFAEQSGHLLLEAAEMDAVYYYLIQHRA